MWRHRSSDSHHIITLRLELSIPYISGLRNLADPKRHFNNHTKNNALNIPVTEFILLKKKVNKIGKRNSEVKILVTYMV